MEKEFKTTLVKPSPEVILNTADYIAFISENSDMNWNKVCDFIYDKGYLTHDSGPDYLDPENEPRQDRVDDHGYDYEYEFAKSHPWTYEITTCFVFDD